MRIDSFGSIFNENDELVGYYEPSTDECFDLNDKLITCPQTEDKPSEFTPVPTVKSKRTYWGVLIAVVALVFIAYGIYRIGKKRN